MRVWPAGICLLLVVAVGASLAGAEEPPAPPVAGAGTAASAGDIAAQRIAVLELSYQGDYAAQLQEWVPELIESRLAEDGWTVLARGETMAAIQQEQNLAGVDPTTAAQPGHLLGATALLQLTARAEVEEIDAAASIGPITLGGLTTARFYLNGQIVDTQTGVIQSLGMIRQSRSRLRTLAIVFPQASWLGVGFNIGRIRDTLMGSAADAAAQRLVDRINLASDLVPGREPAVSVVQDTISLAFPEGMRPSPGAEYGIYRGDRVIAKVRVVEFRDGRALCRVLEATDQIRSTDVARPLEVVVPVQVEP